MRWFHALMPKEEQFVQLFCRHADTLVAGAGALRTLLDGGDGVPAACAEIVRYEQAADDIARETLIAVRQTFITPFDRGDIKELASSLDDAIDQMQKTAKAITLFEVREFEPQMRELGDLVVKAAALTSEAMPLMSHLRRNAPRLNALAEQITKVEDRADEVTDLGMKALFLAKRGADPMGYIVGAEIYDHLEKVVDRFEDVANRVSGILIENL
jgi:predicted phosphate transport protein (TIGR00153 family)